MTSAPVDLGYIKGSFFYWSIESRFVTGRIFAMGCSTQFLVQVMLFQLLGYGHTQDGAMPKFYTDPKRLLPGLLNEIMFVSEFILGDGKKRCKRFE